jgi:phage terminase large subunit-like protein
MPAGSSPRARRRYWNRVTRLLPGYDPWLKPDGCVFDIDAADLACMFYSEVLTHVKGEWSGQPILLEEWQQSVIGNLFGWKRPDGTRRYRQMLFYVPRKNAKTTLGAGIALYLLLCDGEAGADVYSAAGAEDQAALCFDTAKGMVVGNPELSSRCRPHRRAIIYEKTASGYYVLTSKATTKHGLNPHGIIIDEVHALKDRELVDVMTTAVGSRRQPLTIYLTTADFARPSICNEVHKYGCEVRDGIIDDSAFLPVIYEATREDDWTKESTWRKANPNLGVSVKLDFLRTQCKKAQDTPTYENTFKRLHLNIVTEQADRWLQLHRWDGSAGTHTAAELLEVLAGQTCYGGLDLSSTTDLSALALVFPPTDDRSWWGLLVRCWAPRDNALLRERRDRVPYLTWARDGFLTLTDGDVIDYDAIRKDINEIGERYHIADIAIDRWASAQITNQLQGDGFTMVPFGQGFASLSAPTKEFENKVKAELLWHGSNPLLRWSVSNVAILRDPAENVKPSKKHSTERIDPVVGSIMALGRAMARDQGPGWSVYDDRGVEEL